MTLRVAADTGGTFTDFVAVDEETGRIDIAKVPSTPGDPSEAVVAGLREVAAPGAVSFFSHGTTVGTNALLEGKGARTALLVTEGFRGVYEVREQTRGYGHAIFDFFFRRQDPLARPRETLEVPERVGADGAVVRPLDPAAASRIAQQVRDLGVESVAVCLLFSFRDDRHERMLRDALSRVLPEVPVSLSSAVLPQVREYHRLATTVANAYLRPTLGRYLGRLESRLGEAGVRTPRRYVMQSNGGVTTLGRAAERAVATIVSGPAAGVIACETIGRAAGRADLVTFDMGGTSCDVALVRGGRATTTAQTKIAGHDVAVPMLDIHTVSAGGGTIARAERIGGTARLRVGPDSAGARPGPVAYGAGGTQPTITDAHAVLGTLSADAALGGRVSLDVRAAREAVRREIAEPLGLTIAAAAAGMLRVVDVQMGEAIKAITTRRGFDLREFTLVAFGGAGPLHAARLARELGLREVLVPPHPGVTSALGLLVSDVRHDHVRSRLDRLDELAPRTAESEFMGLEDAATAELRDEGFAPESIQLRRALDLRYLGQGYELTTPIEPGPIDPLAIRAAFDAEHERQFGHAAPDRAVEVVSYRVAAIGRVVPVALARVPAADGPVEHARVGEREAGLGEHGEPVRCAVYERSRLRAGHGFAGPAIVRQLDATTCVLPGQRVEVDAFGDLLISELAVGRGPESPDR